MEASLKTALAAFNQALKKAYPDTNNWTAHYSPNGTQGLLQLHITMSNGDGQNTSFAEPVQTVAQ